MKATLYALLIVMTAICACRQVATHTPHADDSNAICLCKYNIDPTGETIETEKIQMAIDDVHNNLEKDYLIIPYGTYATGALHLRDGVILYFESGAVLKSAETKPEEPIFKGDTQ